MLKAATARHCSGRFATSSVLPLLERGVLEQGCTNEDPSLPAGAAHSADALRPFRRRLYGVLLPGQEGAPPAVVREFIVPSSVPASGEIQPVDVEPCVPGEDCTEVCFLLYSHPFFWLYTSRFTIDQFAFSLASSS